MKDLYIIGAGGFGREVAWCVERINRENLVWNIKGFIDDNDSLWGKKEGNFTVLGDCEFLMEQPDAYAVCAVGSAQTRKKIIQKLSASKVKSATIIDPSVIMSDSVEVGEGTIICAGVILTVNIQIGKHVIINLDCTLGHDVEIKDYVTLYPSVNVSGNSHVGECSEIGTGTQIIQRKTIAADSIIGAGAVIVKNIEEPGTYIGVPAKKLIGNIDIRKNRRFSSRNKCNNEA